MALLAIAELAFMGPAGADEFARQDYPEGLDQSEVTLNVAIQKCVEKLDDLAARALALQCNLLKIKRKYLLA